MMSDKFVESELFSGIQGQTVVLHRNPAKVGGQRDDPGRVLDHYQQLLDLAAPRVRIDALHWLGHFVNGDATFSVDVLDDDGFDGVFSGPDAVPDQLRQSLVKLGRRLNYDLPRIDKDLRGLRTGQLIRVVFDVQTVGLFWYWIHEREYLIGMTLAGDQVDDADRDVAYVAESILELYGRPRRNYGGFQKGLIGRRTARHHVGEDVCIKRSLRLPKDADELVRQCQVAVDPRDLHYVSIFVDGAWVLSADVLDASPSTRDYGGVPAELRRSLYEQVGERIQYDVAEFDRLLRTVTRHRPGRLMRTVFDVESGAIYQHVLDMYRNLVGVTVYQDEVAYAEDRVRTLADDLRVTSGGSSQVGVA
jgi:hypothetical protein